MTYIQNLKDLLEKKGARLVIIWVNTKIEVCRQRMIDRNSDRDTWKLAHWDEYIATRDFSIPTSLDDPDVIADLLIFNNSTKEEFQQSMEKIVDIIENY